MDLQDKENFRKKQFSKISERLKNVAGEVDALKNTTFTKKLEFAPVSIIEEKKGLTLEELGEVLLIPTTQILLWVSEFEELKPKKKQKGERLFGDKEIEIIDLIHFSIKVKKYTLAQVQHILKSKSEKSSLERDKKIYDSLTNVKEFLVGLKKML